MGRIPLRLAVLTTDTPHHTYFVKELVAHVDELKTFLETRSLAAPFDTSHPFEQERESFEAGCFFNNGQPALGDLAPCVSFDTMNCDAARRAVEDFGADLLVVFGTGLLKAEFIEPFRGKLLNLHGGDPEEYRGLDSHLWAVYHNDLNGLVVTLHHVDDKLDTGDIVAQECLKLDELGGLHALRAQTTFACVNLVLQTLAGLSRTGRLLSRPQRQVGRYYSFMPTSLKHVCAARFKKLKQGLEKKNEYCRS